MSHSGCCCHETEEEPDSLQDPAEISHFNEVVASFRSYADDAQWGSADGATQSALLVNAKFLSEIVADAESLFGEKKSSSDSSAAPTSERNVSKVRSTLKQFVREWAAEGEGERKVCFDPLIAGLKKWSSSSGKFILCPGSGLGRLPYELCKSGFDCQGNEFSYHMILGSHWVLNGAAPRVIHPYVSSSAQTRLRPISVPDEFPQKTIGQMSMCAGEFVEVYEKQGFGFADGIATCFFLDTAKNILLYIRTIAAAVKAGGVWVNFGPLLFHYAEQNDEVSLELSWSEIRVLISDYFDFKEERDGLESVYASNAEGVSETVFNCVFFAAVRNGRDVEGYSNPVF